MPKRSYKAEGYLVFSPPDAPAPTAEAGPSEQPDGNSDEYMDIQVLCPSIAPGGSLPTEQDRSHKVRAFIKLRIDPRSSVSDESSEGETGSSGSHARNKESDYESGSAACDELSEEAFDIGIEWMERDINLKSVEIRLHKFWQKFVELTESYGDDGNATVDVNHLIVLILQIKEWGTITRANAGDSSVLEEAVFSNGQRLWTDLPFLAEVIRQSWVDKLDSQSWAGLFLWTAKLASVGICSNELLSCGLWLLSEGLENEIPVDILYYDTELHFRALLNKCANWFQENSHKLVKLCAYPHLVKDANISHPLGPLAAHIGNPGLSKERWLFWRKRIQALATQHKGNSVGKEAERCDLWTKEAARGAGVDIPEDGCPEGESSFSDKYLGALPKRVDNMSLEMDIEPSIRSIT